jgi:hypothetical protein
MAALGISLFSAPFVFDATAPGAAAWTAWVGGALLLFFAPWVLGFTGVATITASVWVISAAAFIVSSAALRHGDAVTGI